MTSPVDQIKERLSIVDVVSSYIKLDRAGTNYKARCPFHNEKTPSFFVSPARNNYHCFGCNRGGDIFTFVEEIEGVQFIDALKTLAEKAGVALDPLHSKENQVNKKSYELLDLAAKFFEFNLEKNEAILDYLQKRGLRPETIKNFRIGYALNGWENLVKFLKARGFSESLIEQNGLAIKGKKGLYDRFRSRIMFPIADSQGRIVAFSGRIWGEEKNETAKYVNSPETELYNKSRILYGYDKAKRAMMQENFAVIVEGQMDLVLAHQAGTLNTVAVSGTAFTEEHVKLIKRFTEKVLLAFDSDEAGLKAAERAVMLALSLGLDVRIVPLPEGLDPADFILKSPDLWKKALGSSKHIVDHLLDHLTAQNLAPREFRLEVGRRILPYIYWIANAIDQAHFIKEIASRLDLDEDSIRQEIERTAERERKEKGPEFAGKIADQVPKKNLNARIREKIFGLLLWQEGEENAAIETLDFKKRFEQISGRSIEEETGKLEPGQKTDLIFQAEMYYEGKRDMRREAEELLDNFEKEALEEKLADLLRGLRRSEQNKNEAETEEFIKKCHDISKRINIIKSRRFLEE